jgi:Flp pilus assembly protein TadD
MLALAHKRQGNYAAARAAFRKIARPDANVLLQLGLLSLREGQLSVAVEELARAWEMDLKSYATVYNLVMAQLSLGQFDDCRPRIAAARKLAPSPDQERLLASRCRSSCSPSIRRWRPSRRRKSSSSSS